jgi:hypothetical protein
MHLYAMQAVCVPSKTEISLVICTRNRATRLGKCPEVVGSFRADKETRETMLWELRGRA